MRTLEEARRGFLSVLSLFRGRLRAQARLDEINATGRKTKFFALLSVAIVVTGCGSAYSSNGGSPLPISVVLATTPPASMQTSTTANVVATVSNDSANKGVTWSCAPSAACGSFTPAQTASGTTTTYTSPANVPAGGSVTITATSVSDTTKSATANVTITAPPISVAISTAPPASMQTNATASIAATVSNDPANKGVTWSCVPSAACGSFTPAQTASGTTTTYTAPANVPSGGSVTITATSVSDTTKSATASVTITAPPPISVAITTAPPASMHTNDTTSVTATVSNDPANKGVTWSCAPSASCGSFTPTQTASGTATTYTAPAAVPPGGSVTVTATAVSDVTQTASATVAITVIGSSASLTGQYAFLVTGQDSLGSYAIAGSLTFDGKGNITAGEQDLTNMTGANPPDPVTGTYTVGPNGRGTMTLYPQVLANTETFAFTITSSSHALLNQDDGTVTGTGSGVLDLQTAGPVFAASQFSGGYSFTLTGEDQTAVAPAVFGGVFTADGTSNLQAGTLDQNDNGTFTSSPFTATFTAPNANGRGTITFSTGATFAYYLVRPGVVRLVETDLVFVSGGTAYAQGTASSFTNASLAGRFVFNNVGSSLSGPFAAAGQFVTDGNGNFAGGIADANDNGSVTSGSLAASTYAFSNSPRGTITIPAGAVFTTGMTLSAYLVDPNLNLLDPNHAGGGGGALTITRDANIFGVGMIVPQATPASSKFSGNYAVNLTSAPNVGTEADLTGQVVADLSSNLNGTADYASDAGSSTSSSTTNVTYTGTFVPDGSNPGRFTGTLLLTGGTLQFVPGGVTQKLSYYQADDSRVFVVETDGNVTDGILIHQ
ncbi:MAG TPA: hypothetical protein VN943_04410 [Candidatus Acidoferrum sp.]|nr:hypothetical protein [Candidatus Acidoferrum sp.]